MPKLLMVAIALTIVASVMPPLRGSAQTTRGVATPRLRFYMRRATGIGR